MRVRILSCCVVLLLALVPGRVGANHGDSCGGAWPATGGVRDCPVAFTGFPLSVYADACPRGDCQGTAPAQVRVWLTVATFDDLVLVECSASGAGFASCDEELSAGTGLSTLIGSAPLTCNVSGTRGGVYGCSSGCVSPTQGPMCQVLATVLPSGVPTPTGLPTP